MVFLALHVAFCQSQQHVFGIRTILAKFICPNIENTYDWLGLGDFFENVLYYSYYWLRIFIKDYFANITNSILDRKIWDQSLEKILYCQLSHSQCILLDLIFRIKLTKGKYDQGL